MLYRILLFIIGVFLTSLGLSLIIIYMSFNNVGISILKILQIIIKSPATPIFVTGLIISLLSLFYDLLRK